ncbi:unnamed protein product, partial [Prorocentrum cordatum]
ALAEESRWKRLTTAFQKCEYEENDAGELVKDVRTTGARTFLRGLPGDLGLRNLAVFHDLVAALSGRQSSSANSSGSGSAGHPGDVRQDNLFSGKLVAAASQQDTKLLQELTGELDPADQPRELVKKSEQGGPLRSLGPDEAAFRAAGAARKAGRFVAYPGSRPSAS